ncbi:hypothetical protein L1987_58374 [Smallanthus sonchifolius]|uniref:Uncharacterized protein n=1 Tax=Smallanthus sonchifolius TaxID=185202 RepID=A0ACB9DF46_9ASTR|nr:hypothetical protein L1987_58374 [Smallanthus sonchifolius]
MNELALPQAFFACVLSATTFVFHWELQFRLLSGLRPWDRALCKVCSGSNLILDIGVSNLTRYQLKHKGLYISN